jgi:hypothetical protein
MDNRTIHHPTTSSKRGRKIEFFQSETIIPIFTPKPIR